MSRDPARSNSRDGRGAVVDRRTAVDIRCDVPGDRLLAQLEDKIGGVITLFDTAHHGLRAINVGLDQRVPTGALIAVVATRTCWVPAADTVAPTEDLV